VGALLAGDPHRVIVFRGRSVDPVGGPIVDSLRGPVGTPRVSWLSNTHRREMAELPAIAPA